MREYIVNLTNNLIGKHRFDIVALRHRHSRRDTLVGKVKERIEIGDVANMSHETLGRIMGSLEIGDVMASKQDLFSQVHFAGDCGDLLRELVALCLAYAITARLDHDDIRMNDIPAYRREKEGSIGHRR